MKQINYVLTNWILKEVAVALSFGVFLIYWYVVNSYLFWHGFSIGWKSYVMLGYYGMRVRVNFGGRFRY